MPVQALSVRCRYLVRKSRIAQIGLILGFWLIGEAIVRATGLPMPGSIVGMALTLLLLLSRRVSAFSLRQGAEWFLAEMLVFFVPAVLAVIDHREFLGLVGLKILLIILTGTMIVMAVTGLVVDFCLRWTSADASADRAA
jgi:holin-like protein